MKKKSIILLIAISIVIIAIMCLGMNFVKKQDANKTSEQEKATFEVDNVICNSGEEITLKIKLLEDLNFVAANFEFLYDSTKMEYVKYEKAEILKNAAMCIVNKDKKSDKILIAYVGDPQNEIGIVKQGGLLNITFKIKDTIENTEIKPEFRCTTLKDKSGQDIGFNIKQGTILVGVSKKQKISKINSENNTLGSYSQSKAKTSLLTNNSTLDNVETEKISSTQEPSTDAWNYHNGGTEISYAYYTPAYVDDFKNVPLIVWLHGNSDHGDTKDIFIEEYLKSNIFSNNVLNGELVYVLAPRLITDWCKTNCWCGEYNKYCIETMIQSFLQEHKNVDENNIVIAGHSMGGQGALYFAEYSNYFSKIAVLSGYVPRCGKAFSQYKLQIPGICYIGGDDDPTAKSQTKNNIVPKFEMEKAFSFSGSSHKLISRMAFSDDTGMHVRDWWKWT